MRLLIEPASHLPKREDLAKIYARVFTSKDGKMILEDLAQIGGMYRTNFVQNSSHHTAYLEGQKSLLLYICSQLEEEVNNIEGDN